MEKRSLINETEKIPTLEQSPSERRIHVEYGLDKWLDLVENRKWTKETMPEQEKVWKANQGSSALADLVNIQQISGQMAIDHYWPGTLGSMYKDWFLPQTEKINEFCGQNNILFVFTDDYIKRIKLLHDKLIPFRFGDLFDKGRKPKTPKDITAYDTDPILIPFMPYIREIEKEELSIPTFKDGLAKYHERIKQIKGSPEIIKKIHALLDAAKKSGSSYAMGNEAKEAIDLYLENIKQKKILYGLLKAKGIKIPVILTYLNTGAIIECALFEKEYNDRTFNPLTFSREQVEDYLQRGITDEENQRKDKLRRMMQLQILGQEYIDLQNEVVQK